MLGVVVLKKQQSLMGKYSGLWVCQATHWEFLGMVLIKVHLGQYLIF